MGFDSIDRQFKKPKKIMLECIECGSTENVKVFDDSEKLPLCPVCTHQRQLEQWCGY